MDRTIVPMLALLILAVPIVVLLGCGGDDPADPAPVTGPDWPDNETSLPAEDAAALADAADRWEVLREGQDLADARAALAAELNDAWPDVQSAEVTTDGYTIFVKFTDGATAFIGTNELFFQADEPQPERGPESATKVAQPRPAFYSTSRSGCEDALVPPTPKVHIVNVQYATNETSHYTVDAVRDFFERSGWDPNDVAYSARQDLVDVSFTPETLFDQSEYGIVIFIADGGIQYDAQGEEHFYMQCFNGGHWEAYSDSVDSSRWSEYQDWYEDGELITGETWSPDYQQTIEEVWISDDRLAAEMDMLDGTMVGFVTPYSSEIQDEMLNAGAGCVMGWDGNLSQIHNSIAFMMMGESVANTPGTSAIDFPSLLASSQEDGYGFSYDEFGNRTAMTMATGGGDFYMPATLDFEFPDVCQPDGVSYYDVQIHYPGCPENDSSDLVFLEPGLPGRVLDFIPMPGDAEIYIEARSASHELLDTALWSQTLGSGSNEIDLCPCTATMTVDISDYPADGPNAATSFVMEIDYSFDDLPSVEATVDPGGYVLGLTPDTDALTRLVAYNENGDIVGIDSQHTELSCDGPQRSYCFGWFSFTAGNYPTETAEIVVTAPYGSNAIPASVSFAPGEEACMYGFTTGILEEINAEAFNSLGVSLGTTSHLVDIGCGVNEIAIDFAVYGIILETSPAWLPADGTSQATITATLQAFQEGDLLEPTGDPIIGKLVEFDASCGDFVGPAAGTTDDDGEVTVHLTSEEPCMASVRALVMEDLVESRPALVNFDARMSFWINGQSYPVPEEHDPDNDSFRITCSILRFYFNDQFIIEREIPFWPGGLWGSYNPGWAVSGDRIRLQIEPLIDPEHDTCNESGRSSVHAAWVHTAYEPDFVHQGLYQLTDGYIPLTGTANLEVTIEEIAYYADKLKASGPSSGAGFVEFVETFGEGEISIRWLTLSQAYD